MSYYIGSTAEFLELIESQRLENYIFRGQNEPYWGISASGFRPYGGSFATDKFYDLNSIVKDFYNKVVRRLTKDERKHFLAYCQHHGLPTNLVDFSYSPLIGLFFACYGKSEPIFKLSELIGVKKDSDANPLERLKNDKNLHSVLIHNLINKMEKESLSENAQLYLIKRDKLIDATDIMVKYSNRNIFDLLESEVEVQSWLYENIVLMLEGDLDKSITFIENIINLYQDNGLNLIDGYIQDNYYIEESFESDLYKYFKKFRDGRSRKKAIRDIYIYIHNEIEDENMTDNHIFNLEEWEIEFEEFHHMVARVYLLLLINLITIIRESHIRIDLLLDFYFSYNPPEIFDRLSNQKGILINQPFIYEIEPVYNYGNLIYQKISPDIIIQVENYSKILSELNYLGINTELIYNDVDNIARSVKYNHDIRL